VNHSLLAQLASKFTNQAEVVSTDALCFILRSSAGARRGLQALLGERLADAHLGRIATQDVAGAESRPDLSIFGDKDQLLGYVEAKFWAGLMATQPVDYLGRLAAAGGRVLLFVVPRARVDSVWTELLRRCDRGGHSVKEGPAADGSRSGVTSSGVALELACWDRLVEVLRRGAERERDHDAVANVDQLAGLVRRFEDDGFAPMNAAELTDLTVPHRVRSLAALVQSVVAKGQAEGLIETRRLLPTHSWTSAGRYMRIPHGNAWFGLDHDAWAQFQVSPLWLIFLANDWGNGRAIYRGLQRWETTSPRRLYLSEDDSAALPLFVAAGAERDEVIADVIRQLREIDQALERAGISQPQATTPE
jgi:hypothetical protein